MSQTMYPRWASNALKLENGAYANLGQNPCLGGLSSFTLEASIYLESSDTNSMVFVIDKSYCVNGQMEVEYSLYINNLHLGFRMGTLDIGTSNPIPSLTINQWHTIAASYDATTQKVSVYLDGVYLMGNSRSSYGSALPTDLLIGANRDYNNQPSGFFNGKIRSVMIWDVCRSQGEILSDSINSGTNFFHISNLSSENPSDNPTYTLNRVSPVLNVDFSKAPMVDSSGNNNTIELIGSAVYELSIPSASFSGSNVYVSANNAGYHITNESSFSIDGWFLTNKTGSIQNIVSCGNGTQEYGVYINANGYLEGQRGSQSVSCAVPLVMNQYYHFALSYNYLADNPELSTLSLFVNGNLASVIFANNAVTTQLSVDLLIGAANNSSGTTTHFFGGQIQSINFWTESHDEAQVRQWMYNEIIDDEMIVSAFDFSVNPAIDTANQIPLTNYASYHVGLKDIAPSNVAFGLIMPINATYLYQKEISLDYYPPIQTQMAVQPEIFSEQHKQEVFEGIKKWMGPAMSSGDFKSKFEQAYEQAKQIMNKDPRLKKVITRIDKDGITKLIYHGRHRDQVIFSSSTGIVSDCTLWWIGFVTHLTVGFLEALGLFPSIEGTAEKVYLKIVGNSTARKALVELTKETITVSRAVEFFDVLNDESILWTILKILLSALGWWALGKLLITIIGIVTGLEAAALLVGFIIWAAQLVILALDYNGACGTAGPPTKVK